MKTTMAVLTAMMMSAMVLAPVGSADRFEGEDCGNPASWPANAVCKTAFGPFGHTHKGLVGVGLGVCGGVFDPLFPCKVAGGGAVFFDVSGGVDSDFNWNDNPANVEGRVWAKWVGGSVSLPDSSMEGFELTVCSDRNDDSVCTNGAQANPGGSPDPVFDDYVSVFSSCFEVGNPQCENDTGVKSECNGPGAPKSKDSKDPCDPFDAEAVVCFHPDVPTLLDPLNAGYDDVVVFVGSYSSDSQVDGSDQFHASSGNFEVWLEELSNGVCE